MIIFRRFSKQWYWEANKSMGIEDDISVTDEAKGGGCRWEFMLREYLLGNENTSVIRIEMFEDAFESLKNKSIVKMLIDLQGCKTLTDAERILRRHKFKERIAVRNKESNRIENERTKRINQLKEEITERQKEFGRLLNQAIVQGRSREET